MVRGSVACSNDLLPRHLRRKRSHLFGDCSYGFTHDLNGPYYCEDELLVAYKVLFGNSFTELDRVKGLLDHVLKVEKRAALWRQTGTFSRSSS